MPHWIEDNIKSSFDSSEMSHHGSHSTSVQRVPFVDTSIAVQFNGVCVSLLHLGCLNDQLCDVIQQ